MTFRLWRCFLLQPWDVLGRNESENRLTREILRLASFTVPTTSWISQQHTLYDLRKGNGNEAETIKIFPSQCQLEYSFHLNWKKQDQFVCFLSKVSYHGHWLSPFAFEGSTIIQFCWILFVYINLQHFVIFLDCSIVCLPFLLFILGFPLETARLYLFRHQFCQSHLISSFSFFLFIKILSCLVLM